jgi:hypothetical protein
MTNSKVQEFPPEVWTRFCKAVRAARELFPRHTDNAITLMMVYLVQGCNSFSDPSDRGHAVWGLLHFLVTAALKEQNLPINASIDFESEELSPEEHSRRWEELVVDRETQQEIARDIAGLLADVFGADEVIDASRPDVNILSDLSFLGEEGQEKK